MKIRIKALALVSTMLWAGAAHAQECSRPPAPDIPDGATATREEMVKAQQVVKSYVKETEAYIACINKAEKAAIKEARANEEKLSQKERQAFVKRHNAAVESVKKTANAFNRQIKAFQKSQE